MNDEVTHRTRIGLVAVVGLLLLCATVLRPAPTRATTCDGRWHAVHTIDVAHSFGDYNSLNAVAALSPTDVWAVGQFHRFAKHAYDHTLAEHWDGSRWSVAPTPNSSLPINILLGVAASAPNDVWAVGYSTRVSTYSLLVEHFDGASWTRVKNAVGAGILNGVLALSPTNVWAVGSTGYIGRGLIEHWDGRRWTTALLHGAEFLTSIAAVAPNDIWVVGYRSTAQGSGEGDDTFTAHFDGTAWKHVHSPSPLHLHNIDQNWLLSVTAVATNDVWAVGVTRDTDYGILDDTLTEHWDGARWRVVRSPDPGGSGMYNDLRGVAAVAANDVWAVGWVGLSNFYPISEQWNGTRWKVVDTPAFQGNLLGIAQDSAPEVWAVGNRVRGSMSQNVYNGTLAEHLCPASPRD